MTRVLSVLLVLAKLSHWTFADDESSRDRGQCTTTTNSNDIWKGTLSLSVNDKCELNKTVYSWQIDNAPLLNITDTVKLHLTFLDFTRKSNEKASCDSEKIEVIENIGAPKTVCRETSTKFQLVFNIHQNVRSFPYIRYIHNVSRKIKSFSIEYKFPEYPCFSCPDTCVEDPCLLSDTKCKNLEQAYKCAKNPCESNPCLNYGTCSEASGDYICTCPEGFAGRNCSLEMQCSTLECKNGGTCVETTEEKGVCKCPSDVWGETCETINDGTYCSPETDKYNGSKITWKETKIGQIDTQKCPDANGTASRRCLSKDDTAFWSQPDLSLCVSPVFGRLLTDIDTLMDAEEVTSDAILNLTSLVEDSIKEKGKKRIYAGDLSVAAETVEKVSALVKKVKSTKTDLADIAQGCGNAVSSIIDPETSTVWSFTKMGYLENKITTILRSLEELASNVAEKTSDLKTGKARGKRNAEEKEDSSESYSISTGNLEFSIHVLDRASNFSTFSTKDSSQNTFLSIPMDIFDKAMTRTSDPYIHMYTSKLTSVAALLADTNSIIQDIPTDNITKLVNSEIISCKVLNVQEKIFQTLRESVKLTFTLQDTNISSRLQQNCVFLNMSSTSGNTRWLNKGCYRSSEESNDTHTVCYCTHLTNFAVLMDIYDVEDSIDDLDSKILTYFTYGGGAFSILGCLISVIVFEFFRLKNERVRIHEQLALTIILVQLFFLVGIDRTENKYVCMAMAICLHYSLVAMFCWMLVEGAHLYLVLVKVFKSKSYMKLYFAIGWGVPLIIVGISAGLFHSDYGAGPVCWLTKKVLLVAFVPAVGLVIVINTIVLIIVMRIMLNSMSKGSKATSEERSSIKTGFKAAAVLLPLLGLTWTFGFLSITSTETLVFTYLFTFFNSLQGVFFFVFHCLLSADVQNAYDRHSRRRSQMRKTESSFSKRGTLKRESDLTSSLYTTGYSKNSMRTTTTDASQSPERKRTNSNSSYKQDSRHQSVVFDDDVFYDHVPSIHGSVSSQIGRSNYRKSIPDPILHSHYDSKDGYHGDHVLNNNVRRSSRHGSQSSNDYVLYYGKNNVEQNDLEKYHAFDKNDLYSSMRK